MKKKVQNPIRKLRKKLGDSRGFSLGELLAATIIILLASQVLAEGVSFAVRMYNETLTRSHGKQLCSTLTASIETELRYATSITYDEATGVLKTYFSPTYGQSKSSFLSVESSGDSDQQADSGEIAILATDENAATVYRRLISDASYSSFGLKAKVGDVIYQKNSNTFTVTLTILDKNDQIQVENTFQVIPVNKLVLNGDI